MKISIDRFDGVALVVLKVTLYCLSAFILTYVKKYFSSLFLLIRVNLCIMRSCQTSCSRDTMYSLWISNYIFLLSFPSTAQVVWHWPSLLLVIWQLSSNGRSLTWKLMLLWVDVFWWSYCRISVSAVAVASLCIFCILLKESDEVGSLCRQ